MQKVIAVICLILSLSSINLAHAQTESSQEPVQQVVSVNINTADANTLATSLKGIGLKKAEAIISFRETNGPFMSLEEITLVKGIGMKTIQANESVIKLK